MNVGGISQTRGDSFFAPLMRFALSNWRTRCGDTLSLWATIWTVIMAAH